jgi:hypothetical protein
MSVHTHVDGCFKAGDEARVSEGNQRSRWNGQGGATVVLSGPRSPGLPTSDSAVDHRSIFQLDGHRLVAELHQEADQLHLRRVEKGKRGALNLAESRFSRFAG